MAPATLPETKTKDGLRPPLKWAGGKRWQIPHLLPLWRSHARKRLVEPFCGGLAVTLGLMPDRAVLNDVNPHVINFYRWLKHGLVSDVPMENDEQVFYRNRDRFNALLRAGKHDSAESAGLFYYLNRTGFNGLCRFNRSGEFNVPFGKYKRINYTRDFSAYSEGFEDWSFTLSDFEAVPLSKGDFVYADPPYDVEFTHYSQGGFPWDAQVRAAEWLARHRGPVVLSNQATARIVSLYRKLGYSLTLLDAPRRISCTGDRTPAKEAHRHAEPMTPRNTNTGGVLEAMILPALERGGYAHRKQVKIGLRHGGGTHKVDAVATKDSETILVSMKWQQTGGTAEQKVPFEVTCLAQAVIDGQATKAYLVLGGDGWTLRDYYVSGKLAEHLIHADRVKVVTLEAFIRLANNGQL